MSAYVIIGRRPASWWRRLLGLPGEPFALEARGEYALVHVLVQFYEHEGCTDLRVERAPARAM
jgi:hypothetical protein